METQVLTYFLGQGAFAVLFVWLFIDTRKDSKAREKELQGTITKNQAIIQENQSIIGKLTEKFNIVDDMKEDIKDIKEKIFK